MVSLTVKYQLFLRLALKLLLIYQTLVQSVTYLCPCCEPVTLVFEDTNLMLICVLMLMLILMLILMLMLMLMSMLILMLIPTFILDVDNAANSRAYQTRISVVSSRSFDLCPFKVDGLLM